MVGEDQVVSDFRGIYYDRKPWLTTRWRGRRVLKNPCDLWVYQEILYEVRPRVIIETGTAYGGSALFFADIMSLSGPGHVYTVDVEYRDPPDDPRITCLGGGSTDREVLDWLHEHVDPSLCCMVVLDSEHTYEHVTKELALYADFVTPGSYLVVEDTNVLGVARAVSEFTGPTFKPDLEREHHLLTFNPGGWLRRQG